ncbi:MAG: glycosyltransferase family 4 protein, partial [Rhizobiales bacterium]|nr:glycosyltransferase family 4 protein [Hyphomicrobiales bacterium]
MHIFQVTPTSYAREGVIGGGERIALYIDQAIRAAAAESRLPLSTTLLALDAPTAFGSGSDRYQGIVGKAWDARSVHGAELIQRLRGADIVLVHQCLTEVGLFTAAHARLLGKPVFGSDAGAGESALLGVNPDAALVYDAVHAISRFGEAVFAGLPVPIHVIPGPVDSESYKPPARSTLRDPRSFLAVGRVLPHKGYERTIRALPDGCRLDIVGQHYDGAYLAFLRSCIGKKDIRFHADLDDAAVHAMFASAGLFVHASTHVDYLGRVHEKPELLGLAPLEALSTGLRAVVSDAGSLPELGILPGCHVFHTEKELAALLRDAADGRLPEAEPAAMHA